MEKLKTLLVANRGEIAVRIIRTARQLDIRTISIYSASDAGSEHVLAADESVLLKGSDSAAYIDVDQIIAILRSKKADAVIPGYGFLSENADFARRVKDVGSVWVGPSAEAIEAFGIKHTARELAEKAGVPIVPGSKGLMESEQAAVKKAEELGFPIMLKATGGGGGMGLVIANDPEEVRQGFKTTTSRAQTLFKNPGIFLEKYYPASRHVEIQVFGNGQGKAIHFGERECSIQRRHQKVIEECPSPFVNRYPGLREMLGDAAVNLAQSVKYASAGTVEYLVDNKTGSAFFLEMNTRLQVEHGITELCYDVDLVKMMLEQADAELAGKGGLSAAHLESVRNEHSQPKGAAIEARVYAENPLRKYAPSPGLLTKVDWAGGEGARIDTWVCTGTTISPNFDPLIAKVMFHSTASREDAILGIQYVLRSSVLCGPPNNLDFLAAVLRTSEFEVGHTLTSLLDTFTFTPPAIDVLSGGALTLIQDYPGRPKVGKGIPHSGAMDPLAFQVANALVGNAVGTEGLEITLSGPELRFIGPAVVALCGAPMQVTLDGQEEDFKMWSQVRVKAGQRLKIGKTKGAGCRSYLAVHGGFPNVAEYYESKSTSPVVALGGYQGRALTTGDLLSITSEIPSTVPEGASLPERLIPTYSSDWEVMAMPGPHEEGYLLPEDIEMVYSTEWKVSHNTSRSAVRLIGPVPQWARKGGGQGGSHPSNLIEYGYPLATLNWTGDDPCIFPVDCPNFGGFVSSTTVIRADWWKLGQLKAGDRLKYRRVSMDDAVQARRTLNKWIKDVEQAMQGGNTFDDIDSFDKVSQIGGEGPQDFGKAIVDQTKPSGNQPLVTYRQGGDSHIIIEYGSEEFDLNHRCRVTALEKALLDPNSTDETIKAGIVITVGCCTTLNVAFDPLIVARADLLDHLKRLESALGDLSNTQVPTRIFRLPISFESKEQDEATKRYMETQRSEAPYLPDARKFVAENNAFTLEQLKDIFLKGMLAVVVVGFYSGNTVSLPVLPSNRMSSPKTNPSRSAATPAGTVGWGGRRPNFEPGPKGRHDNSTPLRSWLFQAFDLLTFYQVSEQELDGHLADFNAGKWTFTPKDISFDMKEHNQMLKDTAGEVAGIRARQSEAQAKMLKLEEESLERWRSNKDREKVDEGTVEALMTQGGMESVDAPIDANVWKIMVSEGDTVKVGDEIVILEAMKLEISVKFGVDDDDEGIKQTSDAEKTARVEKIVTRQGEVVKAGSKIALVKWT
ncbi:MAG: hypothetical protein M1828_003559 [Chrysothrix sp. TS-e1954]|nr:MAG: hypothetical protein M1828_003559 [Chrysothrix sp. TS-e1954]